MNHSFPAQALGHLRTLQLDDQLVARDSEAYGALAARIATEPAFRQLMRLTICRRNAWLFEADKAVDEWARFLRNVARRTHLAPPPMVWPWAASRDAHAAQRAKDIERGYL